VKQVLGAELRADHARVQRERDSARQGTEDLTRIIRDTPIDVAGIQRDVEARLRAEAQKNPEMVQGSAVGFLMQDAQTQRQLEERRLKVIREMKIDPANIPPAMQQLVEQRIGEALQAKQAEIARAAQSGNIEAARKILLDEAEKAGRQAVTDYRNGARPRAEGPSTGGAPNSRMSEQFAGARNSQDAERLGREAAADALRRMEEMRPQVEADAARQVEQRATQEAARIIAELQRRAAAAQSGAPDIQGTMIAGMMMSKNNQDKIIEKLPPAYQEFYKALPPEAQKAIRDNVTEALKGQSADIFSASGRRGQIDKAIELAVPLMQAEIKAVHPQPQKLSELSPQGPDVVVASAPGVKAALKM
jgi:hypothetical protein